MIWFLIASGGALGAVSRYMIDRAVTNAIGPTVLGTFLVNVTGSFALGMLVALSAERTSWPAELRMFLAVGFLGSYTTFSTLAVSSIQLLNTGDLTRATLNILGSLGVGLLAALFGMLVGRILCQF